MVRIGLCRKPYHMLVRVRGLFQKLFHPLRDRELVFVVLDGSNDLSSSSLLEHMLGAFLSELAQFCRVLIVLNSFSKKKWPFILYFQLLINFCRRRCTEKCRRCTGCRRRCTEKRRRKTVLVTLLLTKTDVGGHLFCRRRCTETLLKFCRR